MQRYFRVTPSSVHQMVLTLEENGFIERNPGQGRSIRLLIPREQLPDLELSLFVGFQDCAVLACRAGDLDGNFHAAAGRIGDPELQRAVVCLSGKRERAGKKNNGELPDGTHQPQSVNRLVETEEPGCTRASAGFSISLPAG